MFRNIATSELPGETPALSLTRIFALLVLKKRECPRPEIALALQGLQFFCSSHQVLALIPPSPPLTSNSNSSFSLASIPQPVPVDLGMKSRPVALPDETFDPDGRGAPVQVRKSAFDRFLEVQNKDDPRPPDDYTFYQDITKSGYPVFSNGITRPVWPPTEEYAYSMLLLHKPGVRALRDVKGEHATYVAAFEEFLARGRPHVPDCLVRDLNRAFVSHLFCKPDKEPNRCVSSFPPQSFLTLISLYSSIRPLFLSLLPVDRRAGGGQTDDGSEIGTGPASALSPACDGDDGMWGDMGDDGTQDWDIGDKLQNPAPAGFGDIDHCTTISIESIANYKTFVSDLSRDYYAAAATPSFALPRNITGRGHSPYFDPVDCMDNDGQRFALTFVLDFLDKLHQWRSSTHTGAAAVAAAPPPFPRILLLGEAGTGKSFVLRLLQSFVLIYAADASAFLVVAPTGAAGAALCAPTADRAFKFDRTAKSPAPLANEHLLTLQAFYWRLVALAGMSRPCGVRSCLATSLSGATTSSTTVGAKTPPSSPQYILSAASLCSSSVAISGSSRPSWTTLCTPRRGRPSLPGSGTARSTH
jgi:hypothetical protein